MPILSYYDRENTKTWIPIDSSSIYDGDERFDVTRLLTMESLGNSNKLNIENHESRITPLEAFKKKETTFDYTSINPVYHTQLNPRELTIMQCFVVDVESGDIYVTQSNNNLSGTSSIESYTLSRLNKNGMLLDSMDIVYGGHGTTIGLERENGKVYIWSNIEASGYELVRFPYTAGKSLQSTDSSITRYNKFNNVYTIPVIDQKNDLIAFRIKYSDTNQVIQLRKLSEVKSGIDNLLGTVNIPTDLYALQGFTIDGYDLYWYTGDSTASTNGMPHELSRFSFTDGQLKKRISCTFGKGMDGNYEDNFREPESVFLYTDPKSGDKSLLAGVITGNAGKRINKVYAYHQRENGGLLSADLHANYQAFPLTQNNGGSKRIPDGITKLSDVKTPGYYYLTSTESDAMTDHPLTDSGGWWFDVLGYDTGTAVRQILTRNSVARMPKIFQRIVGSNGTPSEWMEISSNQENIWTEIPLKNGATNYNEGNALKFAVNSGFLIITGRVNVPYTDGLIIANVPSNLTPKTVWYFPCPISGTTGSRKIAVFPNGDIQALGWIVNETSTMDYTFINLVIPIN